MTYNTIINTNADCAVCGFSLKFFNTPLIKNVFAKTKIFKKEQILQNIIFNHKVGFSLWNKIFRADLLEGMEFDCSLKFGEDFDFVIRYVKKCKSVAYINKKMYKYMYTLGSETNQKFSEKKLTFINCLQNLIKEEQDEALKQMFKAWLAFTSNTYIYLIKKSKYSTNTWHEMWKLTHENKQYFKKFKIDFIYKTVFNLGLKTWAKKEPKLDE